MSPFLIVRDRRELLFDDGSIRRHPYCPVLEILDCGAPFRVPTLPAATDLSAFEHGNPETLLVLFICLKLHPIAVGGALMRVLIGLWFRLTQV